MKMRWMIAMSLVLLSFSFVYVARGDGNCNGISVTNAAATRCPTVITTIPAGLGGLLENVASRITFQYAAANKLRPLIAAPVPLEALLEGVTSRVTFQATHANRQFGLTYPLTLVNDNTPPQMSNVTVTTTATGDILLTWTTDEFTASVFRYGAESGVYPTTMTDEVYGKTHQVTLTGLEAGQTYYYQINHTDLSGNIFTSAEMSFVTALAQVAVNQQVIPNPVQPGGMLTYTILVTNTGTIPLNATITDTLPAQVHPTTPQVWSATILPNETWLESLVVTVQPAYVGVLTNLVKVTTLEGVTADHNETTQVVSAEMPTPGSIVYLPIVIK